MKPLLGKDVFKYLKKLGNENHDDDPLDDIKQEVFTNTYEIKDIPISKILSSDIDAKYYVSSEMKSFKDDYTKRVVKSPILIDDKYNLKDGHHRLAQQVFNGKRTVKSFVPIK